MAEGFTNLTPITLGVTCLSTDLTITLAGGFANLPTTGTFRLLIEAEILIGTARVGAVVTVTRGAEMTTAAGHTSGVTVIPGLTKGALAQFAADIAGGGGTLPSIVWRPGGVAAGNVYTDFPTALAAAVAVPGDIVMYVDSSLAAATVSAGIYDCGGTIIFSPYTWSITQFGDNNPTDLMTISDGAVLHRPLGFRGPLNVFLETATSVAFSFNYVNPPWDTFTVSDEAYIFSSGTFSAVQIPDGSGLELMTYNFPRLDADPIGGTIFELQGSVSGAVLNWKAWNGLIFPDQNGFVVRVTADTTNVAVGSNGVMLPQAIIFADTTGFPASGSIFIVLTSDGSTQSVSYTATTGTSFTGCTGGVGTMTTEDFISDSLSVLRLQHDDTVPGQPGTITTLNNQAVPGLVPTNVNFTRTSLLSEASSVVAGNPAPAGFVPTADGALNVVWSPPATGDNARARRYANGQSTANADIDYAGAIRDTGLVDGTDGTFAGTAIATMQGKVYFAGRGAANGEHWALELGGNRLENISSVVTFQQGAHCPNDLIAFNWTNDSSYFVSAGKGGIDMVVDCPTSRFLHYAGTSSGAEDWTGVRIAYSADWTDAPGGNALIVWTAPLVDKIYFGLPSPGNFYTFNVSPGFHPTCICPITAADTFITNVESFAFWVSFPGASGGVGVIRRMDITWPGSQPLVMSQVGPDISTVGLVGTVIDMLFDGKYVWVLTASFPALYRFDLQGNFLQVAIGSQSSFFLSDIQLGSRLAFDGHAVWLTISGFNQSFYTRIDPDTGTGQSYGTLYGSGVGQDGSFDFNGFCRGIVADAEGNVYIAKVKSVAPLHLVIGVWEPPRGGRKPVHTSFCRATTSGAQTYTMAQYQTILGNQEPFGSSLEVEVKAQDFGGGKTGTGGWWKMRLRTFADGTVLAGDPINVDDSPRVSAGYTIGFTYSTGIATLTVTSPVTASGLVYWTAKFTQLGTDDLTWGNA